MIKKVTKYLSIFITGAVIIIVFVLGVYKYEIANYIELSKMYGINPMYLYFRYKTVNTIFSVAFTFFALILLSILIIQYLKVRSHESKILKFVLIISMLLVSSCVIGAFHCINYYGFNSRYTISKDILKYQQELDNEKFNQAQITVSKKKELVSLIENKIGEFKNDSLKVKFRSGSVFFSKTKYLYRYDVVCPNESLAIFFQKFPVNRSIRFSINKEEEKTEFVCTLPDLKSIDFVALDSIGGDREKLIEVNKFYNRIERFKPYRRGNLVSKNELLSTTKLIRLDFDIVNNELLARKRELKDIGISWDLFIWDTLLVSVGRGQNYFKGFSFTSRSLIFIHGLLVLFSIRLILPIAMKK
ncbi:hypothetical protein SAMN04489761_0709 [Tenacibaculum sp. MAR_2009_124]|uniref:hypothetical protein n=1 Tax=Tenacibaculum sp. MAR_2009_124 TaxID=1250059 RepID=UPI00089C9586|nr:hypothetical protein [Tenacibaculum sp. MAR_2009_124]SEB43727.1 hypothetical protein SAMN04489761_0709 [Tenacibaculum sp. MAR_2009_124]